MNIENTKTLIGRLEQCVHSDADVDGELPDVDSDKFFNMNDVVFHCKSPACVAGHCADLMGELPSAAGISSIEKFLEIDREVAYEIFGGFFSMKNLWDIEPKEAIAYLNLLLATD